MNVNIYIYIYKYIYIFENIYTLYIHVLKRMKKASAEIF